MTEQGKSSEEGHEPTPQQPSAAEAVVLRRETWVEASYSGPIPQPAMLRAFDEVLPGAAHRILTMAEEQQSHRHLLERTTVLGDSRRSNWGLVAGFVVALAGFVLVAFLAYVDQPLIAGIIGVLDISSIVLVFVAGSRQRRSERELKWRQMQSPR